MVCYFIHVADYSGDHLTGHFQSSDSLAIRHMASFQSFSSRAIETKNLSGVWSAANSSPPS